MNVVWPAKYSQIPKEIFHRDDVFREELQRIFYGPEWHPVAHVAELPDPGAFKTFTLGNAPIIIMHGQDGRVRVFLNSCPHRGNQLETCARGTAHKLECPYHRWTFDTDGSLLGAPGMADFPADFSKASFGLTELRSEVFRGLVFTTFASDVPPLERYLGEAQPYL